MPDCQYKKCKEVGWYWYPLDGIIYDLCEKHWNLTHKNRKKILGEK